MMKRNLQTWVAFILMTLMMNGAYAQAMYGVSGLIQSASGEPLVGASIKLTASKKNESYIGTSTDSEGHFVLRASKGNYLLEISFIGYATYTTQVELKGDVNLPPVILNEDAKLMNELVITARTITYNTDGYVAEISKNPLYRTMDLNAVLKMTPGTFTTPNSVQLYGRNVAIVYLNGRELKMDGEQLINYLEGIEAKNVKEMEVITASGVEEDATSKGESIIKITTVNPETGGMANVSGSTIDGKDKNIHTLSGNVNWRINSKWGTYVNLSSALGNTDRGSRNETHFCETDERRIHTSKVENDLKNIRGVLGITYDLDKNNLFSVEGTLWKNRNENPTSAFTRSLMDGASTDIAEETTDYLRDYLHYNLSFIYTHKFKNGGQLSFKADYLNTHTDDDSHQRYRYTAGGNTGYDHLNDEENDVSTLRADYTVPLKGLKGKLSIGAKSTWLRNESYTNYASFLNGQQDQTTTYADRYRYKEDIYALYAKYAFTYKKLSLNVGVRMEDARIAPRSSTNPERNHESHYTDLFPEVRLNYTINKEKGHNLNLSYDRGLGRPWMMYLNPLVRRTSEYSYSMGNPLLEPTYSDNLMMTFTLYNKYALNVRYFHADDGSFSLSENKDGILYSTYQNGMERSYLSMYLNIPVKLAKWWNVNLMGGYDLRKEDYVERNTSTGFWHFSYSMNITLPKNFRIEHTLSYLSAVKGLYGKESERPQCYLDIVKAFPKQGWRITLGMADIFNRAGAKRTDVFNEDFYQSSRMNYSNFGITLRVNYNFRWGQKSMVRRGMSGNMEEMTRIVTE